MRRAKTMAVAASKAWAIAAAVAIALLAIAPGPAGAQSPARGQRFGNVTFTIPRFREWEVVTLNANTVRILIEGAPNQPVVMTSPQYELTAQRLEVTFRRSGPRNPYTVSTANANGGVRAVVRQPGVPAELQETRTLTCDRATFAAAAAPPAVGRIDLKGNVRSVLRGPAFPEPIVAQGETGFIELSGNNRNRIVLNNGSASGTVREPAARRGRP